MVETALFTQCLITAMTQWVLVRLQGVCWQHLGRAGASPSSWWLLGGRAVPYAPLQVLVLATGLLEIPGPRGCLTAQLSTGLWPMCVSHQFFYSFS